MNYLQKVVKQLYPEYTGPIHWETIGSTSLRTPVAMKIAAQLSLPPVRVAQRIADCLQAAFSENNRYEVSGPGFITEIPNG